MTDTSNWIPLDVYFRDTQTGQVAIDKATVPPDWFDANGDLEHTFWWTEGNFGCDCNRCRVFEGLDLECNSGENRIELVMITKRDQPDEVYFSP